MKFKANGYSIKNDISGNMEITFNVEKESAYSVKSISDDKDLSGELAIEVKKYRKSSVNQIAKFKTRGGMSGWDAAYGLLNGSN